MSIRLPKPILFLLAFLLAFALYWPALNGTLIWDDFSYWFFDPAMKLSYQTIWRDLSWPLSVTIQKLQLSLWDKNYFLYHMVSFLLHCANAFLVYLLGREAKLKYKFLYFLIFLIHPVCVITTAWIIQVKTLLCFFFALASLLTFFKAKIHIRWMILSWILFYLSVMSKSASLTLPFILLAISFHESRFKKIHLLIPFFLISSWAGYRVLTSPVTIEGTQKASIVTAQTFEKLKAESKEVEPTEPKKVEFKIKDIKPQIVIPETKETTTFPIIRVNTDLTLKTLYYYFWQALLPTHTEPIKGLNLENAGFEEYLHLFFLVILFALFWNQKILLFLGSALLLLLPFLGIVPAPFMNITWASDQHMYLVLPCLLAFWFLLLEKITWKYTFILPSLFVLLFSYKTYKTTPFYQDQLAFYKASLDYNPYNVPISYNLAFTHILKGQWMESYQVVSSAYYLAENEPQMKKNIYYPYLAYLYFQMRDSLGNHEN